jgi:hypothetical protein
MIVIFCDEVHTTYNRIRTSWPYELILPTPPDLVANWDTDIDSVLAGRPTLTVARARVLLFHVRYSRIISPEWVALTPELDEYGELEPFLHVVKIRGGSSAPAAAEAGVYEFLSEFPTVFPAPLRVGRIAYYIDNSGSMVTQTVAGATAAITSLVKRAWNRNVEIVGEFEPENERWVSWVRDALGRLG